MNQAEQNYLRAKKKKDGGVTENRENLGNTAVKIGKGPTQETYSKLKTPGKEENKLTITKLKGYMFRKLNGFMARGRKCKPLFHMGE